MRAHGKIYDSILDTMGGTPLVRLPRITKGVPADLCYKLEFFNPCASVKDRIGINMLRELEASGTLKPGGIIVEPTSGNTGIGVAFAAAAMGYKAILVMPESMSIERRKMMAILGAELVLTPAAGGIPGAMAKAEEIIANTLGAVRAGQFDNPANPAIHYATTGPEIWEDCAGQVDAFIAGVGTGGTLSGAGKFLKEKNPNCRIIAIEPTESPVISGGDKGPHKIQGIGAGFIPDNLNTDLVDEVVKINSDAAFGTAKHVAAEDGVPVGISSGAAIAASLLVGARPDMHGKRIVTIIPSFAERYLSTPLFDDDSA
ncbi:cysteine synthase A [Algimonas ampicilliniresistens]|uniref:Cysteine synthase n=1 Tax=Algimonas ampicilliniresistens TaxID=1298735 RepID=A0ABQ5VBP6_9PROT|nr:cysteine synthase A [Algimonas ampicilliniresistens]GLQ24931.1 cysteine synthase A [Algimonas ampicilliniresistens]